MQQYTIFALVKTVLLDVVIILKPIPQIISLVIGGDAPKKFEEFFKNKVLEMCLGIN